MATEEITGTEQAMGTRRPRARLVERVLWLDGVPWGRVTAAPPTMPGNWPPWSCWPNGAACCFLVLDQQQSSAKPTWHRSTRRSTPASLPCTRGSEATPAGHSEDLLECGASLLIRSWFGDGAGRAASRSPRASLKASWMGLVFGPRWAGQDSGATTLSPTCRSCAGRRPARIAAAGVQPGDGGGAAGPIWRASTGLRVGAASRPGLASGGGAALGSAGAAHGRTAGKAMAAGAASDDVCIGPIHQ